MGDRASEARVDFAVYRARVDHARERECLVRVRRPKRAQGAEPLALGGSCVETPREGSQRALPRPPGDVLARKECTHLVPEGARLSRRPVVRRRLADEVETPRGPGARGVEEEPLS